MATRKATTKKAAGQSERVAIFLPPEQSEWLKKKGKISETVRALITEAMNMERLAESIKQGKSQASKKKR